MIGRLFGWEDRASQGKRDHVRILPYDGRKEVDFDKFFERQSVQDQIKRVREEIIKPQQKRVQGQ